MSNSIYGLVTVCRASLTRTASAGSSSIYIVVGYNNARFTIHLLYGMDQGNDSTQHFLIDYYYFITRRVLKAVLPMPHCIARVWSPLTFKYVPRVVLFYSVDFIRLDAIELCCLCWRMEEWKWEGPSIYNLTIDQYSHRKLAQSWQVIHNANTFSNCVCLCHWTNITIYILDVVNCPCSRHIACN